MEILEASRVREGIGLRKCNIIVPGALDFIYLSHISHISSVPSIFDIIHREFGIQTQMIKFH